MINFKKTYYMMGVSMTLGMMGIAPDAYATPTGNDGKDVTVNIIDSISRLPDLLAALSYLGGITLGTLGVLKIKDHVENPTQTQLKEGAIRLASGGALLSLPILFETITNTVGTSTTATTATDLQNLSFQ